MLRRLTEQGLRFLEEGQFEKAGQILSLIINRFPENAEAHHMLGIIELERGNYNSAFVLVNTAIDLDCNNSTFYNTMGNIELHRNNLAQAEKAFKQAIQHNPEKIEYQYNLANFFLSQSQYPQAIEHYYNILRTNPTHYLAIRGITVAYLYSGETDIALEHANEWANEFGDYDEPFYYLGLCLYAEDDINGALAAFDKGLNIAPNNHEIISAIGACYRSLGNIRIAETYLHKALGLEAHNPTIIYQLGCLYLDKGDLDAAHDLFQNAISLDPTYIEPICGLGNIELVRGHDAIAIQEFVRAQKIEPNNIIPQILEATTFLRNRDFKRGWELYNKSISCKDNISSIPMWAGQLLNKEQTLLVWVPKQCTEISLQIMLASMFSNLQSYAESVVIMCDEALIDILQLSFPKYHFINNLHSHSIVQLKDQFSFQCPTSLLGKYFRTNIDDFSSDTQIGYLETKLELRDYYSSKYRKMFPGKKLMGISWKTTGAQKSTHLHDWAQILNIKDCQFICLQPGVTIIEHETIEQASHKHIYIDPEISQHAEPDFNKLSAQIAALDIVLTVDNTIAHLAGALGIKTYVLVPMQAEWYWFKDLANSVWHPNTTIIRQIKSNDWAQPIQELYKHLGNFS